MYKFTYIVIVNNINYFSKGNIPNVIQIEIPPDADPGLVHNNGGRLRFEFDQIFDVSSSQEYIFDAIAHDKIFDVLDGVNSTIFAYGQTGSG